MRKYTIRRAVAGVAVVLTIGMVTTVANADDGDTVPTETTTAPVVTIKVEDVPDTTQGPPSTERQTTDAPTTDAPSTSKEPGTTSGEPRATEPDTSVSGPTSSESPSTSVEAPSSTRDDAPTSTAGAVTQNGPTTTGTATVDASTAVSVGPTTTLNPNQNHSDQETQVGGTQVAIGNSGDNVTANNPTNGSSQVPNNSIGSGAATAIGSDDTNIVDQNAQVVLTDQAVANILQAALIINVGAALANTGLNGLVSTPGGGGVTGAIDSGNANAVGNDMQQYITQAANATGDANTDDAAKQLAVSLWMGLGLANSGTNAITGDGTGGTGGAIGAGDATAIGNRSLTDIMQGAAATGSGTSQINIEQYATVMNLGFALANSGINDISGVATDMLTAGDTTEQNQLAQDLFSMLLPALLSSYATTGGAGQIASGDATAVGNDSQTYVEQLAKASASGDGIASIIQSVLVANTGAAGANTGGNAIGGRYANLNPQAAKAVVTLAAFLSQMLALVHTSSSNQAAALAEQGMDVPFGDIVLTVRGQLQGYDTTLTNATGAKANVRQVTIILSLGIAQANSGLNGALGVNTNSALAARVGSDPDSISTGDADAQNGPNLVIICQRRNADDIECLAPPPPPPPADNPGIPSTGDTTPDLTIEPPDGPVEPVNPRSATPEVAEVSSPPTTWDNTEPVAQPRASSTQDNLVAVPQGSLPSTGADASNILMWAAIILGLGTVLFMVRRRPVRHAPEVPMAQLPEDVD